MAEQLLYTIQDVADALKISRKKVYELKREGLIPFMKLDAWKCRREALEDFLREYDGYDLTDLSNIRPLNADE